MKSKNSSLDINTEITNLEHISTDEYLWINEKNCSNYKIDKEKNKKGILKDNKQNIKNRIQSKINYRV